MSYTAIDPETGEPITRNAFFPIPHVKIPVLGEDGLYFAQWGKRRDEDPEFDVPVTGWARILSLKEGKWSRYNPKRVRIPAQRWMEKDAQKNSHWFEMAADTALLGVEIEQGDRRFVYVVTHPAAGEMAQVHARAPMVVAL